MSFLILTGCFKTARVNSLVGLNPFECTLRVNMSIRLCSRADCPFAEFTDDLCDVESVSCVAYWKARDALTRYFKFADFRPGQLAALMPVLHGKDVLVRMATGAGKSLCIYLVPLAMGPSAGGVLISPLNGLMDQQVCFTHVGSQLVSSQPQLFAS